VKPPCRVHCPFYSRTWSEESGNKSLLTLMPRKRKAVLQISKKKKKTKAESPAAALEKDKLLPINSWWHHHPLDRTSVDNGWACDGRKQKGGCRRGTNSSFTTSDVPRYHCEKCDFDLCDKCVDATFSEKRTQLISSLHPHHLCRCYVDDGWKCEGHSQEGGCRSGITGVRQSKGILRYRCEKCNYDLCEKCLAASITGVPQTLSSESKDENIQTTWHDHHLFRSYVESGWQCDGRRKPGGCHRGEFEKMLGIPRYRCERCDYDLCDKCVETAQSSSKKPVPSSKTKTGSQSSS